MSPFGVKDKMTGETTGVPCGKCPACYARRVSQWSFRLVQEDKVAISSHFITLTYDTNNVPITQAGFMGLDKRDLQLFFKRLRKRHDRSVRIRYFAVGEYGGKSMRPHYHVILFNADIKLIDQAWSLGMVHYGTVTGASIGYCMKYISKPSKIPLHKNDDRKKEFAIMSQGLGITYLSPSMVKWHLSDGPNRMYVTTLDGKKIGMPRYYKNKIYSDSQRRAYGYSARKKMLEKLYKLEEDEMFSWNKLQADIAAYRSHEKMISNLYLKQKI